VNHLPFGYGSIQAASNRSCHRWEPKKPRLLLEEFPQFCGLRKRWGQYSPDRYPVPSEHSGDGFERVIRQKAGKEALSPMVKGKRSKEKGERLKEKHHNCERSVFPLAFVL
jgi:hypothetical protein